MEFCTRLWQFQLVSGSLLKLKTLPDALVALRSIFRRYVGVPKGHRCLAEISTLQAWRVGVRDPCACFGTPANFSRKLQIRKKSVLLRYEASLAAKSRLRVIGRTLRPEGSESAESYLIRLVGRSLQAYGACIPGVLVTESWDHCCVLPESTSPVFRNLLPSLLPTMLDPSIVQCTDLFGGGSWCPLRT